jgi:preprotein translocase subunit SecD
MNKNLRWRVITIVVVVALGVWAFYPPGEKINLGLDLKGGVHLVLRVQTDDALKLETETTVERLRDTLTRGSVAFAKLETVDSTSFIVEGIQDDQAFRAAAVEPDAVFNRGSGAGRYTYTMKPNIAQQLAGEAVTQALQTIERRVNELGVAEPIVPAGHRRPDLVELPGVSDARQGHHPSHRGPRAEVRGAGPFSSEDAQGVNNSCRLTC